MGALNCLCLCIQSIASALSEIEQTTVYRRG